MRRLRFALVPALLGLAACADPVNGELSIVDDEGRTVAFAPDQCVDGNDMGFLGVQMEDEYGRTLDFFEWDGRPGLIFHAPGRIAFELDPADCDSFGGRIEREFNRVTDNGKVNGDLEVSCRTPDGWTVQGVLTFEDCYAPEDDCDDDY